MVFFSFLGNSNNNNKMLAVCCNLSALLNNCYCLNYNKNTGWLAGWLDGGNKAAKICLNGVYMYMSIYVWLCVCVFVNEYIFVGIVFLLFVVGLYWKMYKIPVQNVKNFYKYFCLLFCRSSFSHLLAQTLPSLHFTSFGCLIGGKVVLLLERLFCC